MPTLREDVLFYADSLRARARTPWEAGLLVLLDEVAAELASHAYHALSARDTAAFLEALDAPPVDNPALRALLRKETR
jgi:hypothetical protein